VYVTYVRIAPGPAAATVTGQTIWRDLRPTASYLEQPFSCIEVLSLLVFRHTRAFGGHELHLVDWPGRGLTGASTPAAILEHMK
jgi:hypothetical protein